LELYTLTVKTKSGQSVPIAIPIINKEMKGVIGKATGIDTALLPPVLPLQHEQLAKLIGNQEQIADLIKSPSPVLNEQTWEVYYQYLDKNLQKFNRRHFEEFSYIKIVPKTWVVVMLYIFALGISIGVNFWTHQNEFTDENPKGDSYSYRNKFRY
jgi:hypothetical protein